MKLTDGVHLHILQTNKFKDIIISLRFLQGLEQKQAAARSLLALMLCDRCQRYDTKQQMSKRKDELYGLSLIAQTMGYGQAQVIELRCRLIDPRYVTAKEVYMQDVFAFLHEVLFRPLLCEDVFMEAKRMLLAKLSRLQDDPAQLAVSEGLKTAGAGTPLGISALGEREDVEALTLQDIRMCYERMLQEDAIDVLIGGDVEPKQLQQLVAHALPFTPRNDCKNSWYVVEHAKVGQTKTIHRSISQTYLMMTWFTHTSLLDEDYYGLRVANAMLGQYAPSLLFQEVREKRSLCYSIFSNLISYDGALGVTTGIEAKDVDAVIALIEQQLQRLQQGAFDEELLSVSKQLIINSLKTSNDHLSSMIALAYQNVLMQQHSSVTDIIERIAAIQHEDVMRAISRCEWKSTLILTKEDDHA